MLGTGQRIHRKQGDVFISRQWRACMKKYFTWPTGKHLRIVKEIVWIILRIERPESIHVGGIELRGNMCTPRYRCRYPRGRCRRTATVSLVIRYGKWKGTGKTVSQCNAFCEGDCTPYISDSMCSDGNPLHRIKKIKEKKMATTVDLFTDRKPLSQADQGRPSVGLVANAHEMSNTTCVLLCIPRAEGLGIYDIW